MRDYDMAAIWSLAARIAGAVLIVVALVLVGLTEHADRLRAMGEQALGGFVLSGGEAQPGPSSDGRLVFVAGPVRIAKPAYDAQFNVSANALALVRNVEMFQWHVAVDDEGVYEQDWIGHPVDSAAFAQPAGHANPGAFPFGAERFESTDVHVGGFKLGPKLVHDVPGIEDFKPDLDALPANMAATFQVYDGALVTSANPGHPQIGDLRVSWQQIAPNSLTVLARAQGGELVETLDAAGHPLSQVQIGKRSLSDVVPDAAPAPSFAWARRALALLLAWLGVMWLASSWRDRGGALLLAFVPLALLAAAFWFGSSNLVAWLLVLFAVLAGFGAFLRWRGVASLRRRP